MQSQGKILLVDDDPNIVELLSINLTSEGYAVDHCDSAEKALQLDLSDTNLVIADVMRQEYTGLDLLDEIRLDPTKEHLGVIITSSDRSRCGVIDALDAGADDFIEKPFSLRELLARVRSVMRRHVRVRRENPSQILCYRDLKVDLSTKNITDGDSSLNLTSTEYAILVLLLKNIGIPTSRREIFENVWKDSPEVNNDRIVDTNISRLRKKLGDTGSYIQNRSGLGYLFVM